MISTKRVSPLVAGVWLALAGHTLAADLPAINSKQSLETKFQEAARQAPDVRQTAHAAKDRLTASIDRLEHVLAGGGPDIAERWSQWLQLPQLKTQLERDSSDQAVLQEILDRYYRNEAGLELPTLVAVRQELRSYLAAREYAAAENPGELYAHRLTELAECLKRLDADLPDERP